MKRLLHIGCTLLLAGASLLAASAQPAVPDSVDIPADGLDYGLHIVSYPAHSDEFTGLALEDGKAIPVKGKTLEMSFNCTAGRTTSSAASSASSPTRGTTWT